MSTNFLRTHTLHPSVEWLPVGESKLQIRSPFVDRITFDQDAELLGSVLRMLRGQEDLPTPPESDAVVDAFVQLLNEHGLLVPRDECVDGDWLAALLDFQHRRHYQVNNRGVDTSARPLSVSLHGNGWIRDCAQEALADLLKAKVITYEPREPSLRFVCADEEDYDSFREANRAAISSGSRVAFAYRISSRLVLGPLVVPHESACMECYYQRLHANMIHKDEFNEYRRLAALRRDGFRSGSAIAAPYFRYAILRYVANIAFQLYDTVEPGVLYAYDVLDMEPRRQPVLKLPRCEVCGRVHKNQPAYAVRDLA